MTARLGTRRPAAACAVCALGLALDLLLVSGCRHAPQAPSPVLEPPPAIPQEQIAPPRRVTAPAMMIETSDGGVGQLDTTGEARVTIDTHGSDVDVRQVLAFIAEKARLQLVYSPEIKTRIRLQLIDVPVSQALAATLSLAGLTLEGAGGSTTLPHSTSIVFYQLPVDVDSLSVESIMKRFGVGRGVAELIVQGRPPRP